LEEFYRYSGSKSKSSGAIIGTSNVKFDLMGLNSNNFLSLSAIRIR
jgi:hypothetical protein